MKQSFFDKLLDNHGRQIGAALYGLSTLVVVGLMALAFVLVAPKWIEVQERLTAGLQVAESVR